MFPISTTAQAVLATANADRIKTLPERLPTAARRAVVQSLTKARLLEEVPAAEGQPAWRTTEGGERVALRATEAGVVAAGGAERPPVADGPPSPTEPVPATPVSPRLRLRIAAEAALASWGVEAGGPPQLAQAMANLRDALATIKPALPSEPRPPRTDTKQAAVLALLRRVESATIAQVMDATGWQQHRPAALPAPARSGPARRSTRTRRQSRERARAAPGAD